ncbi:eukaryotic translation initiation factor 5B-like protein [Tanacetum coccineum]
MGHVDAGKTKLFDYIKRTNVQKIEAGGITQQISTTYIPTENLRERRKDLNANAKIKVAGLLVIDAPGHKSFNNIRSRGSSLCDVAILVVNITNGLQPQTIESIKLLKMKNTNLIENHKPSVVVASNKVDRLYGWKTCPDVPIANALKLQSTDVHLEFKDKVTKEQYMVMPSHHESKLYIMVMPEHAGTEPIHVWRNGNWCFDCILWYLDEDYQKIKWLGMNKEELMDYFESYDVVRVSHIYGM